MIQDLTRQHDLGPPLPEILRSFSAAHHHTILADQQRCYQPTSSRIILDRLCIENRMLDRLLGISPRLGAVSEAMAKTRK
jgi:hypothetical protein